MIDINTIKIWGGSHEQKKVPKVPNYRQQFNIEKGHKADMIGLGKAIMNKAIYILSDKWQRQY
jgi:hypothetical protein